MELKRENHHLVHGTAKPAALRQLPRSPDFYAEHFKLLLEVKGLDIGSAVSLLQGSLTSGRRETLLGQVAAYMAHVESPLLLLLGPEVGVVVAAHGVSLSKMGDDVAAEKMELHIWRTIISFNSNVSAATERPRRGIQVENMSLPSCLVGLSLLAEQTARPLFWL